MAPKTADKKAAPKSNKVGRKAGKKGKKSVESWKIYIYKVNHGFDPAGRRASRCGFCSDWISIVWCLICAHWCKHTLLRLSESVPVVVWGMHRCGTLWELQPHWSSGCWQC